MGHSASKNIISSTIKRAILMLQINSLMKNIKHERTPILKKYITLPILLSPERDDELLKISDQVCTVGI